MGVRGGFTSSVGQACGERVGAVREEALDLYSCVFEILRADAELEDFFDHRREVGQGLNGVERRKAWCAEKPAEDGQYHGVFHNAQRYPARMPLLGQKTVRTADYSRCARRYTIGIQHSLNIFIPSDGGLVQAILPTLPLWLAQRRTVNADGVAVMPQPAQQRFHHGLVA